MHYPLDPDVLQQVCEALEDASAAGHEDATRQLGLHGGALDRQAAGELERLLAEHPNHFPWRVILLGYYFLSHYDHKEDATTRLANVLWVIRNRPATKVAGTPYCEMTKELDPEGYAAARTAWMEQLQNHGQDPEVLANTASLFTFGDRPRAEQLLRQAKVLDPENPQWPVLV
jgi:hypothetical protein